MIVHVAACRIDRPDAAADSLYHADELKRLSLRPEADQRRSSAGRWLLGQLLSQHCPELTFPPRLIYGEQDKPMLADRPALYFNLSHSGQWAVCALCEAPLGIDIQTEERPIRPALMRKFAPSEQEWLRTLSGDAQQQALFDLWSLKEALCKCTGEGLRLPLNASAFTLDPLTIDRAGYQVLLLPFPHAGVHLGLCVETEQAVEIDFQMM